MTLLVVSVWLGLAGIGPNCDSRCFINSGCCICWYGIGMSCGGGTRNAEVK